MSLAPISRRWPRAVGALCAVRAFDAGKGTRDLLLRSPTPTGWVTFSRGVTNLGESLRSSNAAGAVISWPLATAPRYLACAGGIWESGNFPILTVANGQGGTYHSGFYVTSGVLAFAMFGAQVSSGITPVLGRSYDLIGYELSGTIYFWIDGQLAGTATAGAEPSIASPAVVLGRGTYPASTYFGGGHVCSFAIFREVQPVPASVRHLFSLGQPLYPYGAAASGLPTLSAPQMTGITSTGGYPQVAYTY